MPDSGTESKNVGPLASDWDHYADPLAKIVQPAAVDPFLFDALGTEDFETDALWEAALSPTEIMARARAQRADELVMELEAIDARQARLDARKAILPAALTAAVGES